MPYASKVIEPVGTPEWERWCMRNAGWFIHTVERGMPERLVNYHTHGLLESFGHPDLQIVVRIGPRVAANTFAICVDIIRGWGRGPRFLVGEDYGAIIRDYPVRFADAIECDRPVLRIILPDADGKVALGEISEPWDAQWRHLNL